MSRVIELVVMRYHNPTICALLLECVETTLTDEELQKAVEAIRIEREEALKDYDLFTKEFERRGYGRVIRASDSVVVTVD